MKTLSMKLKLILALLAMSLIFSPCGAKAETSSEDNDIESIEPQAEAQDSSDAKAIEDIAVEDGSEGDMTMMSGNWEPYPPAASAASPSIIGGIFSGLMSESFKTDLATGAATLSIPIVVPPGRKNIQPNIALSYSSNSSNGICGVGWSIPVTAIQRSTKKGVPRYNVMEDFVAGGEELVNMGVDEYRAKIESSFTKYVYSSTDNKWIAYDKSGTQYHFGSTDASRMVHPTNPNYIFAWYIDEAVDIYGNTMTYTYTKQDDYVYPEFIYYTSNTHPDSPRNADKRIEFVYEVTERQDKIYNHRTGWPSIIKRRLEKIKVYIDVNKDSVWEEGEVVWTYNLNYTLSTDTSRSLLTSIQLENSQGTTLPAKTFTYQTLEP